MVCDQTSLNRFMAAPPFWICVETNIGRTILNIVPYVAHNRILRPSNRDPWVNPALLILWTIYRLKRKGISIRFGKRRYEAIVIFHKRKRSDIENCFVAFSFEANSINSEKGTFCNINFKTIGLITIVYFDRKIYYRPRIGFSFNLFHRYYELQ